MGITIKIGDKIINADGYILNTNDMTVQFYRENSILDYIPPIKVSEDMLSDWGREVLKDGNNVRQTD